MNHKSITRQTVLLDDLNISGWCDIDSFRYKNGLRNVKVTQSKYAVFGFGGYHIDFCCLPVHNIANEKLGNHSL